MNRPLRIRLTGNLGQPSTLRVWDLDSGDQLTNIESIQIIASTIPTECRAVVTLVGDFEVGLEVENAEVTQA